MGNDVPLLPPINGGTGCQSIAGLISMNLLIEVADDLLDSRRQKRAEKTRSILST
jgi:hypothetical protein